MKLLTKFSAFLMCLTFIGFSQDIDNVQFTTLEGVDYDLYTLLSEGKYILVHHYLVRDIVSESRDQYKYKYR